MANAERTGEAPASSTALEAVTVDVYSLNAFRLAELSVEATSKELALRLRVVEMALEASAPMPPGAGRALPAPAIEAAAVREAIQRLDSPERRIVEELFWFWPLEPGTARTDPALAALSQGHVKAAREIWRWHESQRSPTCIATHNLAVLFHAEAIRRDQEPAHAHTGERTRALWSQSTLRWQKVFASDGFWGRVASRIRDYRDPRLGPRGAQEIRKSLPRALLGLTATLMARAAEKSSNRAAELASVVTKWSGSPDIGPSDIEDAIKQAATPFRQQITGLCAESKKRTDTASERSGEIASSLLNNAARSLAALDALLTRDHPINAGSRDEVTLAALNCQISFANKTQGWPETEAILRRLLPIVGGELTRKVLEEKLVEVIEARKRWAFG